MVLEDERIESSSRLHPAPTSTKKKNPNQAISRRGNKAARRRTSITNPALTRRTRRLNPNPEFPAGEPIAENCDYDAAGQGGREEGGREGRTWVASAPRGLEVGGAVEEQLGCVLGRGVWNGGWGRPAARGGGGGERNRVGGKGVGNKEEKGTGARRACVTGGEVAAPARGGRWRARYHRYGGDCFVFLRAPESGGQGRERKDVVVVA